MGMFETPGTDFPPHFRPGGCLSRTSGAFVF